MPANRLANETSPYLLQHAHNPVDWYAWGPEAFERARAEGKPILLSIGYSACHWCHVMERESFEDEATARVMNELFVSVKVDREERPDVDAIYMQAVQAMTGHGGWPMTVFLTPDLVPFWGGTYFPPTDRHGLPSFTRVLHGASDAFRNRREDVDRVAGSMREMYAGMSARARAAGALTPDVLTRAAQGLLASYDRANGGFGDAPKFPQPMAMEFLLQQWARAGNEAALDAARHSFLSMARGGIYDQLGGGFARYSVDAHWLVPHFEKMLYDNAQLLRVGVHVWQATSEERERDETRRVCEETVAWLAREMTSPGGGFYSTLDADSEGEEGKFYVWSDAELREVLGAPVIPGEARNLQASNDILTYWGVTPGGNFEGHNILHVPDGAARAPAGLQSAKARLLGARDKRVRPGRDEKILAAWNGLMLRALCDAARAFESPTALELAVANGEFLFREMVRDGRVFRSHKDGVSRIAGFLEDHAAVALGALSLYEVTFDRVWLERSRALAAVMVDLFWSDEAGAFFDTSAEHTDLLTRPRDVTDNATPSGTSLAVELLLKLGDLTGDAELSRRAVAVLETIAEPMARYALAFGHALQAADMAINGAIEVALVGTPGEPGFAELAQTVGSTFVPSLVLAGGASDGVALLADRPRENGRPTAYVCRGFVCERPVTDARGLWDQLHRARKSP